MTPMTDERKRYLRWLEQNEDKLSPLGECLDEIDRQAGEIAELRKAVDDLWEALR